MKYLLRAEVPKGTISYGMRPLQLQPGPAGKPNDLPYL